VKGAHPKLPWEERALEPPLRISGTSRQKCLNRCISVHIPTYLRFCNFGRVHHGRLTAGQIPANIVYGARKMEVR
jgi:hypothetical protein